MGEQLTATQITDIRRYVLAARLLVQNAWANCKDAEAARDCEQAEKLLADAVAILGEEPGDEVQPWEAH